MPLTPPPRDANGEVKPHNHDGISSGDGVIRRISEQHIVFDPKIGGRRLSSAAFTPSSGPNGGMSVDLERQIEEAGLNPKVHVTSPQWTGSVRFLAGSLRAEGFMVGYDPLPENPYHGEVWGNFRKSNQRKLVQLCAWLVPISDTSI